MYETYWTTGRGTEAGATSYHLLDLTVYGRQEAWEDSPAGRPQPYATAGEQFPERRAAHGAVDNGSRRAGRTTSPGSASGEL